MGIIKRQGLKSSIVNYAGVLIGVLFFNFVFPNLVDAKDLGLINLLRNLMYVFATLPALGLGHILLNYYASWESEKIKNSYHGFAIIAMIISMLFFVVFFILLKSVIINYYQAQSPNFTPYYYAIIPLVFLYIFNQYFEFYSLVNFRSAFPAFLREVVTRVLLIILFYLYISHYLSQKGLVIGLIVSYIIPFLAIVFYAIKILKWRIGSFTNYIQKENVFEELKYGSGMLLLTIFSNVSNFLDGIILPAYLGLEVLGIYTPALVLGQMIQVPYRAISLISIPVLREAITQKDVAKLKSLNNSLGINLFLIGCFLFTLLIINSEAIFSLIPPKYSAAKNVLLIVGAGRLLDMAFGLNSEIITYSNDYKYIVRLSGLMMTMTVILNILLIPIFGMDGAALAVSVSLIVFNLLKTYIIYRKYNFHCFSKHYITLIVITISVIGILYCIPYVKFLNQHMFLNPILNIAFKSIIGGFLFLIPSYYFNVSTDFNDFFKLVISGKILKGGHKMENL